MGDISTYSAREIVKEMMDILDDNTNLEEQIKRIGDLYKNHFSDNTKIALEEYIKLLAERGWQDDGFKLSDFVSKIVTIIPIMLSMVVVCFNGRYNVVNPTEWLMMAAVIAAELLAIFGVVGLCDIWVESIRNKQKDKYRVLYSVVVSLKQNKEPVNKEPLGDVVKEKKDNPEV